MSVYLAHAMMWSRLGHSSERGKISCLLLSYTGFRASILKSRTKRRLDSQPACTAYDPCWKQEEQEHEEEQEVEPDGEHPSQEFQHEQARGALESLMPGTDPNMLPLSLGSAFAGASRG